MTQDEGTDELPVPATPSEAGAAAEGLAARVSASQPGEVPASRAPAATRAAILDAARAAVTVDRAATHGAPENTFALIAASWSAKLGVTVTPAQVCLLLADLKACRAWGNPGHADNWVDLAGYAACGGELAAEGPA